MYWQMNANIDNRKPNKYPVLRINLDYAWADISLKISVKRHVGMKSCIRVYKLLNFIPRSWIIR